MLRPTFHQYCHHYSFFVTSTPIAKITILKYRNSDKVSICGKWQVWFNIHSPTLFLLRIIWYVSLCCSLPLPLILLSFSTLNPLQYWHYVDLRPIDNDANVHQIVYSDLCGIDISFFVEGFRIRLLTHLLDFVVLLSLVSRLVHTVKVYVDFFAKSHYASIPTIGWCY